MAHNMAHNITLDDVQEKGSLFRKANKNNAHWQEFSVFQSNTNTNIQYTFKYKFK